jgi:hypothetical protein
MRVQMRLNPLCPGRNKMEIEKRMYLSKASYLHECFRKYYLAYKLKICPKKENHNFKMGSAFHEAARLLNDESVVEAIKCLQSFNFDKKDEDTLLLMLHALIEKFEKGDENLKTPIEILGTEQPIYIIINGWKWYIKIDLTFLEEGLLWKGDYKTTAGYGPATASFYHSSPQTWTYLYVLKKHFPAIQGSKFIILTKVKEPKCTVEKVLINERGLQIAEQLMYDTIKIVETVEGTGFYPRQGTHCKSNKGECEYYPLCHIYDPINNIPEKGISSDYVKEVSQIFTPFDPDEHLGIEGD